jgi:hypothetical protein
MHRQAAEISGQITREAVMTTGAGGDEHPVTSPGVKARDITAALRRLYEHAPIRTWPGPDGTATVRLPPAVARYLGVGRDHHQAAAWINVYAPYGVRVTGYDRTGQAVMVTLGRTEHSRPADPRTSAGVPSYRTPEEVTGEFPASRVVTGLIRLAIEAGCRPHVGPQRSPHGRRYRVGLWHVSQELLHGVIDVMEDSGRLAAAWYSWGCGDERRTSDPGEIRQQLASARDLHRAETIAALWKRQRSGR